MVEHTPHALTKYTLNAVKSGIKALLAKHKRPIYPGVALITSPFGPEGWSAAVSAFLFKTHFRVFFSLSGKYWYKYW